MMQAIMAQNSDLEAYEAINLLDTSVLVVRLDMQKKILDSYQEILDNPKSSEKQIKLINKRISKLEEERKMYKETIVNTMNEYYSFSEYCFIDNHDIPNFINGDLSVLNCPPTVKMKEPQVFKNFEQRTGIMQRFSF